MNQESYIETFALIDTICAQMGTSAYLWGGWIPDVYSGRIIRLHDDAEHLVVDLYRVRSKLQKIFSDSNWETKIVANGDLVIYKDGMRFHFGHLEIAENAATWFHNGPKGRITFPKEWLNEQAIEFKDRHFHAVAPEFQYVLKLHPEFMNPEWQLREKDKADILALTNLLSKKDVNMQSLEERVFCQNSI